MQIFDFLSAFPNARQIGDHWMARCPGHDDKTASLGIKERDGKILIHCFADCEPERVLAAVGMTWADVFNDNGLSPNYNIRDHSGALRAIHARSERNGHKTFAWLNAEGKTGLNGERPEDLPLYGSELVGAWDIDKPVVVAEGEKAALALMAAGLQAVGTVCGASSTPSMASLAVLTANDVVLWPDNDDVGRQHMQRIGNALREVAASVRLVRVPGAANKADAADVGDPAKIRRIVETAELLPSPLRPLSTFSVAPPPDLLVGKLDPLGHTILYGAGGVGKGTYASWLLVQLARVGLKPLILDYEHHPEEWARRVYGLDSDALPLIHYAAPLSAAWEGRRGALWEAASELRTLCIDEGIGVVVVDSLAIACAGNDVSDPGTPALYAAGLELLERPVLSLAHVNRAGDMTYPFGSAFWHNLARLTWSMETDGATVKLSNRKANNYLKPARISIETTWLEGMPRSVLERSYGDTVEERIREVLGSTPMTTAEIAAAIDEESEEGTARMNPATVKDTIRKLASIPGQTEYVREGPRGRVKWSRRARS